MKIIKKSSSYRKMVIHDILEKKNMKKCMCIIIYKKIRKSAIHSLLSFGGTWLLFYTS